MNDLDEPPPLWMAFIFGAVFGAVIFCLLVLPLAFNGR